MVYFSCRYLGFLWEWPDEMKVAVSGENTRFRVYSGFVYVLKAAVFIFWRNFLLNTEVQIDRQFKFIGKIGSKITKTQMSKFIWLEVTLFDKKTSDKPSLMVILSKYKAII